MPTAKKPTEVKFPVVAEVADHQSSPARQGGKCAQCGRLAGDISECGAQITCARQSVPLEVDDVIVSCVTCGTTRVVSTGLALKGKPAIGRGAEGAVCRCGESQVARIVG